MDVTQIQRYLTRAASTVNKDNEYICDVDGDGEVTVMDVTAIQRYLAHIALPDNVHIGKAG